MTESKGKQAWREPEIVSVGCVFDLTDGMDSNVRDNPGESTPKYALKVVQDDGEVHLDEER